MVNYIQDSKRVVIKVGTSTLTHANGKLNLRYISNLCRTITDLQNSGKEIILVTSAAIGVGMGKLGLKDRPDETSKKQALAAIGQCELMFVYDKFFAEYGQIVSQILITLDVIDDEKRRQNVINTLNELLSLSIIPIINENDTVATEELEGRNIGDNDTLSAMVASLMNADALVILTDTDGLYTGNPQTDPNARLIPVVYEINEEIEALAGAAGSKLGTGGMATKVSAARIAGKAGIPTCVIGGSDVNNLYELFDGQRIGTIFLAK